MLDHSGDAIALNGLAHGGKNASSNRSELLTITQKRTTIRDHVKNFENLWKYFIYVKIYENIACRFELRPYYTEDFCVENF